VTVWSLRPSEWELLDREITRIALGSDQIRRL
jgi:hypothetical protein